MTALEVWDTQYVGLRAEVTELRSQVAQYEADAARRSLEGRTDWDYEQKIKRVEAEIARLSSPKSPDLSTGADQ